MKIKNHTASFTLLFITIFLLIKTSAVSADQGILTEVDFSESAEMGYCRINTSIGEKLPLIFNQYAEENGGFLIQNYLDAPFGGYDSSIALLAKTFGSYKVTVNDNSFSLLNTTDRYRFFAKHFGFREIPFAVRGMDFWFGIPPGELRDYLKSGYCLIITLEKDGDSYGYAFNDIAYNPDSSETASESEDIEDELLQLKTWLKNQAIGAVKNIKEGFLTAITSYYSMPVKSQWYSGVEYYLRPKGYNISADLLEYSLLPDPQDVTFDESSEIAVKIKESDEYKEILEIINQYILKGYLSSNDLNDPISLKYYSGDLFTGIGQARVDYNAVETQSGYEVSVIVSDNYDFHLLFNDYKTNPFVTLLNNKAFLDQYLGVINNYHIDIIIKEFTPYNNQ